jgi:hypothetical protein
MGKVIFDFVGGDDEKNKKLEDAMRKELARMGTDPHRTPRQRRREAEIDAELEDAAWLNGDDE